MTWALKPYYLINILVFLIYPAFRVYCRHYNLNKKYFNSVTSERENQVMISFLILICIKYIRHFTSFQQLTYEFLFYSKLGFSFLFFLFSYVAFFWYSALVIIVWVLVKVPQYDGPSKVAPLIGENRFKEMIVDRRLNNRLDNNCFVIYYSPYSDKCSFTEDIWANFSLRYTVEGLNFFKVDVDINESLCISQKIKTKGLSVELPIIVLYKNGIEVKRYPITDKKGNTYSAKYYSKKELINYFELESIYVDCTSKSK